MKKVATMINKFLEGIVNATVMRASNSRSEEMNARIQWLKKSACGFRDRRRFRNAILFHLGGLEIHLIQEFQA